ncbi:multidrug ABC transporter permease [Pediococcus damnosus]|uniref:ABC-type multidrug transport system, permease component n=2 Tax=Pediococcus damnosus TaxID=51663 RepID=A0AAC9FI85_9LACO|nr:ABC-type multidrug transport system, permease component [Pediococcus damnosus]KRN52742.1 multidrug ABC transporter permease [Pediococcus damnosus]
MMKHLMSQLSFDGRRLILRNASFLFFSLLMPAGFYLLFTRVMIVGTTAEMQVFNVTYMGSMIVYSGLISAAFSVASILKHDRDQGFVNLLNLTPRGLTTYYVSIALWSLVMTTLAIGVIGGLAMGVNHVSLSGGQWLGVLGVSLFGQIPLLIMGAMMAFIQHTETLGLVSNLVTFPMAIVSGLWWSISLLPDWLQQIGKVMPAYFTNSLLEKVTTGGEIELNSVIGIVLWSLILFATMILISKLTHKWGVKVGRA